MSTPLVSIVCITYNHAQFIRQCLDGFVMQETSFPFEVLIHDDASTDGTTEIVREYVDKYSDIFIPFYEEENQWGKLDYWKDILFPKVRGKYVALCEGDDYWTDPFKLQKQVAALEARPDVSVCFHPVTVHWEKGEEADTQFPEEDYRFGKAELTCEDLLERNFIQTNSVMYRWRFHEDDLSIIPERVLPEDWLIHLLHAQKGKILFLPENMGVYRRHEGGIWYNVGKTKAWFRKNAIPHIRFFTALEQLFGIDRENARLYLLSSSYAYALRDSDYDWIEELKNACPAEVLGYLKSPKKLFWLKVKILFSFGEKKKQLKRQKIVAKCFLRIFNEQIQK